MIPQINQQANLGNVNQAHLMALSQQGNDTLSYAALMEQATAQEAMQAAASENNLQVPKVNFTQADTLTLKKPVVKTLNRLTNYSHLQKKYRKSSSFCFWS